MFNCRSTRARGRAQNVAWVGLSPFAFPMIEGKRRDMARRRNELDENVPRNV
jgi:hypothetical protein